jgi:hypothetical protein
MATERTTKETLKRVCLREWPDTVFITDLELCEILSRRYALLGYPASAAEYIARLRKSYAIGVAYKCCKEQALGFRYGKEGSDYVSF